MKIHFVCRGNTFRSRIAETYFNSLRIPNWSAISSGIEAINNLNGDITTYAAQMITAHGMEKYCKKSWTQSTKENLENSEIVVFLNNDVEQDCRVHINLNLQKYYIWRVDDIDTSLSAQSEIDLAADATFNKIVEEVNSMVEQQLLGKI